MWPSEKRLDSPGIQYISNSGVARVASLGGTGCGQEEGTEKGVIMGVIREIRGRSLLSYPVIPSVYEPSGMKTDKVTLTTPIDYKGNALFDLKMHPFLDSTWIEGHLGRISSNES